MRTGRAVRMADGLALAADPTFAVMALVTCSVASGPTRILCAAADASPWSGMTTMYLPMGDLHLSAWLRRPRRG